jgi:hypothetical protein
MKSAKSKFCGGSIMLSATRNASIALALMVPGSAFASSDQAWADFAKQVEQKCTEAAGDIFRRPMIAVDPTGTESYGVAIVYGRSPELQGPAAVICVVDKKTGKVEVGSPLGKEVVRVRKPKPAGQDDSQRPRNNRRKQQNQSNEQGQNDQQNQNLTGNTGSQDDMDDDGQ